MPCDYNGRKKTGLLSENKMKKKELLNLIDENLLDALFGFCYARTSGSVEAKELCSDIVFALVKASKTEGEVSEAHAFIWRIARNVYADFSRKRRENADVLSYTGDEFFSEIPEENQDDDSEKLREIYRGIAFLTRAYREAMIMYYLDGLSTLEIAKRMGTSETSVRQRLFSARQKIKDEVKNMNNTTTKKPVAFEKLDYYLIGDGMPAWDDPRNICERELSKQVMWLCRNKAMRASEIAEELNVPTVYVEDELEILSKGEKGKYGLLRKLDDGRYIINFILLDTETVKKANAIYEKEIPNVCKIISDFIEENKEKYMAFPYLNKKVDLRDILWQQIKYMGEKFQFAVRHTLKSKYFSELESPDRPFSIYGYVLGDGRSQGVFCDGTEANNICGYSYVSFMNVYYRKLGRRFACSADIGKNPEMQLAIKAINGLALSSLSADEKEHAAKAIEHGYIYRDGDKLYTKILVSKYWGGKLYEISDGLDSGYFDAEAEKLASEIAALIYAVVPKHLLPEWYYFNEIAALPVVEKVIDYLTENGTLTLPETQTRSEGVWMCVQK